MKYKITIEMEDLNITKEEFEQKSTDFNMSKKEAIKKMENLLKKELESFIFCTENEKINSIKIKLK